MKNFLSIDELKQPVQAVKEALQMKENPLSEFGLGKGKTLIMLFFNSSPENPPEHRQSRSKFGNTGFKSECRCGQLATRI